MKPNTLFLSLVAMLTILSISSANANYKAENFFKNPDTLYATLNPKGTKLILLKYDDNGEKLHLKSIKSGKVKPIYKILPGDQKDLSIRHISWINNDYAIAEVEELKKGIKDLLNTKKVTFSVLFHFPDGEQNISTYKIKTRGKLISSSDNNEPEFLYAKNGAYSKAYKLNANDLINQKVKLSKLAKIDNGQFKKDNEIASIKGYAIRWFTNRQGEVKSAITYDQDGNLNFDQINADGSLRTLEFWLMKDSLNDESDDAFIIPFALGPNEQTYYCLDLNEKEERTVYIKDYTTKKVEKVFELNNGKILNIYTSPENQLTGIKALENGEIKYVHISPNSNTQKSSTLDIVIDRADNNTELHYKENFKNPGTYYLTKANGKQVTLGETYPHLKALKGQQIESAITLDGEKINYILNIPDNTKPEHPLIVMPHGGPIGVFDTKSFDLSTQYFVANGYAVLRVNFRGSGGYGEDFRNAGRQQWGNLMLKDIFSATQAALQRKDIDNEKVCAVGFSYGGYAASMLLLKHPKTFKCGANIAGVSDINLFLNASHYSPATKSWLREYVGDTNNNYDELKAISPTYLVKDLARPLLVLHGLLDKTVDVEQAYRLKLMLEKYNKPHTFKIYDDVGHHFTDLDSMQAIYSDITDFVGQHIGSP